MHVSRLTRDAPISCSSAVMRPKRTRRIRVLRVFKPRGPYEPRGGAMNIGHQDPQTHGIRRLGIVVIRVAVGLVFASAITVAVVAAGLDLLPLWP